MVGATLASRVGAEQGKVIGGDIPGPGEILSRPFYTDAAIVSRSKS